MIQSDEAGRYLSPEPMLVRPDFVLSSASEGSATPSYAYANNNPLKNTDPTGLYSVVGSCANWSRALALAKTWAGCVGGRQLACNCQDTLASCGGCNICAILEDGQGPLALISSAPGFVQNPETRAWSAGWNGGETALALTAMVPDGQGGVWVPWSMFRQSDCDSNTYQLARHILHEAAHACGQQLGVPVRHSAKDPCGGAFKIAEQCRSP